jgi:perosamine synthetase
MIPYGRHSLDASDLAAVVQVLEQGLLTGGPQVGRFEQALAQFSGSAQAVVVSSGTAALHLAYQALGLGPGDEVIVPAITFAATANAALYCGARPVFADVLADSLLIDPASVEACITPASRALVAVDYAGQPCDYAELSELAQRHGLHLIADACHSLGASYQDRPVGQLADVSCLSFHPVKPITSGEGGALLCQDAKLAGRLRRLRNHGLNSEFAQREGWQYAMLELGYNYRLTDIQCALGLSQLQRLPDFIARRQAIARRYAAAFAALPSIQPLALRPDRSHGYHLYVARLPGGARRWFQPLRQLGLGVNVHYQPVYLHPYYQQLGYPPGLCPRAEQAYAEILSLPLYPAMTDAEVEQVIHAIQQASQAMAS